MLGGVEAVHLVDEQDRAQAVVGQPLPGRLHLGAQVLHARQHGVEAAEVGAGAAGDDPRQGGLAGARRAVQDQVADPVGGDGAPQQPARAQDRLLTHEVIEAAGPHPIRQGRDLAQGFLAAVAEQVAHGGSRTASSWRRGHPLA